MIEKIIELSKRFNAWADEATERGGRAISAETLPQILFVLAAFGGVWAFAWNGHIISPWLDSLVGLGPYDIDSPGKIRWRQMYSTAFCAPVITYAIGHYGYALFKRLTKK